MATEKFIASLDVGTTTIRCIIFDENLKIKGASTEKVQLLTPQPGYFEIDPVQLWQSIVHAVTNAIRDARLTAADITGIGISTQRCTFITWDKETDEHFHNFITWKDLRADRLVKEWNSSYFLKFLNTFSYLLYFVSRSRRFLAGSVLKFLNVQVTLRLLFELGHNKRLKEAVAKKTALFGNLDSWILYKFRKGNSTDKNIEHISDVTCCAATGIYDPFTMGWATWALSVFSIKKEMLPKVVECDYDFGSVHPSIFGSPVKIACSMSDQSCSLWGSNCFYDGNIKITLGTGSFLNVNTGKHCQPSIHGLYPLVAWHLKNKTVEDDGIAYCVEGSVNDTGSIIDWAIKFGLFDDPAKSSDIADSVLDSDGVYFIPAFSGLGPPINDIQAGTGFIGLKPTTRKAHLVRALLESIAFRIAQLFYCTKSETDYKFTKIRVDGGVSKNDFLCQALADITGLSIERNKMSESSAIGAAFLVGLNTGIWSTIKELEKFYSVETTFTPREEMREKYRRQIDEWTSAVERFKGWYENGKHSK